MSSVTGQAHGIAAFQSSCRSAAENAATTPSAFRAAVEIDALHARVCVWAADDDHADRARRGHVVDVRAVPGEERRVLAALDGRADVAGLLRRGAHDDRPIVVAASWTATTMLWYPVQRQRFPSRPSRIAASLVASPCSISDTAAITMPGVQ